MKKIVFFLITGQLIYATNWHIFTVDIENVSKCIKDNDADPINYFDKGYKMTEIVGGYIATKDYLGVIISSSKKDCEVMRNKLISNLRKANNRLLAKLNMRPASTYQN